MYCGFWNALKKIGWTSFLQMHNIVNGSVNVRYSFTELLGGFGYNLLSFIWNFTVNLCLEKWNNHKIKASKVTSK